MLIKYLTVKDFIGWNATEVYIKELILKHNVHSILEIGAGANPTINPEFINDLELSYTISDIDDEELKKADNIYNKLVLDFSSEINITQKFDLVFSRMVGEHIGNGKTFHMNVYKILRGDGISLFFNSLFISFCNEPISS